MDGAPTDAVDESSAVLAAIEGGSAGGIYCRVASFLLPFRDLIPLDSHDPAAASGQKGAAAPTTKRKKKPPPAVARKGRSKKNEADEAAAVLRPLAKRFLPFLSGALKLLPSALRSCPREEKERGAELFAAFRLVLDCLACVTPCLAGKPFSVHLQRCTLLWCLESWGKYAEAEEEGVSVLESLKSVVSPAAPKKAQRGIAAKGARGGGLLPDSTVEGADDAELAVLVIEVVAILMRCAYKSKTKNEAVYHRILSLVEEVQPWLRLLDSEASEKYQSALANGLYRCSLFLAGECMSFDANLVYDFCLAVLRELLKSSSMDQFLKVARQLCSSVCLQWESRPLFMLEMLRCSLDSISCKCKANVVCMINKFFEFVHYIVDNCRTANLDVRKTVSKFLYEQRSALAEVSSPVASILGIYAIGLDYTTGNKNIHVQHQHAFIECSSESVDFPGGTEYPKIFADSLDVLGCCFHRSGWSTCDKCERKGSSSSLECRTSKTCNQIHGEVSFLSYLDALGFLCKQLEEYVNTAWEHMISEKRSFHSADTCHVQTAFFQFCDLFLPEFGCNEKCEIERFHESRLIVIHVAVVSLKISLGTSKKIERMVTCVNQLISCKWIEPQELKYLSSSFYKVGASLYNAGQVDKASVAMRLCCKALWTHVTMLSVNQHEDTIKDAITEACAKSAIALDVIHQCGEPDLRDILVDSLSSWSAAEDLLDTSTTPFVLVKQWVKIVCKDSKGVEAMDSVPVLYSLLSCECKTLSKRTLGIILEQELLAYEELEVRHPKLCQRVQLRLIDMLLIDIYATEEYVLPRSRILVKKGQALRACGLDGINSSLRCFSEATSLLNSLCGVASGGDVLLYYQLALTYTLCAHCAQEANQNSKIVLDYIDCALNWWSRISMDIHLDLEYEKTIQSLCGIADLAGLKGNLDFQLRICKLMVVLSKRKNVSFKRCVDMLWSNRRISHAFCSSPIDEKFIVSMSKELGVHANLISFWMSCMESSSSLVGFLQRFTFSDSISPRMSDLSFKSSIGSQVTIEEVKKIAFSLISSVPVASHSAFAAGYLFFDLSERLFLVGRLFEALSYAREALQLRKRILQRKFIYLLGEQPGKVETMWNNDHLFTEAKDCRTLSRSEILEDCIISPWSVLKCYLESVLQVGVIYESIGNGVEAEILFRMGKAVSCSLGFPVFGIVFTCHLGQVYRKKQLLNVAEDELGIAKKFLLDNEDIISCNRCIAALHGTIELQIGDLYRSKFESSSRIRRMNMLFDAIKVYKSALEKLNCVQLDDTLHSDEVPLVSKGKRSTLPSDCAQASRYMAGQCGGPNLGDHLTVSLFKVKSAGSNVNVGGSRNAKFASSHPLREQILNDRSSLNDSYKNRTRHGNCGNVACEKKYNALECAGFTLETACPDICHHKDTHLEPGERLSHNEASVCGKINCWRCYLMNVMETGLMHKIIYVKWECHRRHFLLRLLSKLGKCMVIHSESHEVHEIFWQSMSLLFNAEPLCQTGRPCPCLLMLVGMENPCDIFPIQRAALLYNMGLFCTKDCLSEGSRTCCPLSEIQMSVVLSWLLIAFILTQDIPLFFQKVSRLIAAVLSLSMSIEHFCLPFSFGTLTGSHLAAFFHQASIGTYVQHMYISGIRDKGSNTKDFQTGGSVDRIASSRYLRVAPEKLSDLEEFVNNFFQGLPCFTVICISLLGGDYVNLLGETLLLPYFFPAWMLLSRLDPKGQPIVMLLPVDIVDKEIQDDANYCPRPTSEDKESNTKWECPWGCTLVDCVAPQYKVILEENYLSLLEGKWDAMDVQTKRHMWWSERSKLNNHLSRFLRSMEDSWLGPWRCLLLGECSDLKHLDEVAARLSHGLKSKCKIEANTSILKAILRGCLPPPDMEKCVSQLLQYKGYLGMGGCCGEESFRAFSPAIDGGSGSLLKTTCKLINEAIGELVQEPVDKEPLVLVLDADLQMLPWENIPILRNQEVYRMMSMGSISATLDRNCHHEQAQRFDAFIPSVDPLDAYYLLNPSGDLGNTQVEFEEWFINQQWEGKAGEAPTTEELADALQSHDLFLYFGHGSGTQYIPGNAIQKLDHCAATLLMGCSSGSLFLRGDYAPHGAPLSYLLAGSPAVIANLWEVSDKDIDRFGKAMLRSWLEEATTTGNCTECNRVMQRCGCLGRDAGSTRFRETRRKYSRDKKLKESRQNASRKFCRRNRIASSMCKARDSCKLPLLIGASPVCYGVPTLIKNREH